MRIILLAALVALSVANDYDSSFGQSYDYDYGSTNVGDGARIGYQTPSYSPSPSYGGYSQNSYSQQSYSPQPSYGQHQQSYGYEQQQYGHQQQGYGHQQPSYGHQQQHGYGHKQQSYGHQQKSYGHQQKGYGQQSYGQKSYGKVEKSFGYGHGGHGGYGHQKKVYVPIVIRKKKAKKIKTVATYKGFYIPGGTQMFGKFKDLYSCQKACEITPTCFAADYNPWVYKCYLHTNNTACGSMRSHSKIIHFKKIPCQLVETTRGLITPGAQIFNGLEQKGVKSLQDCLKKCATAGGGIAPSPAAISTTPQLCFGIDYDFGTHSCYFHVSATNICPTAATIPTPTNLIAAPTVVNIVLCPLTTG